MTPRPHLVMAAASIDALSAQFSPPGDELWGDIRCLAGQFTAASPGSNDWTTRWHHFVLAVGNFKRQGGTRLFPAPLPQSTAAPTPGQLVVPVRGVGGAASMTLDVTTPATWQQLQTATAGLGTATTTTLLAALWPDGHFIFDDRVLSAANGLRIAEGDPPMAGIDPASHRTPASTLDHYIEVHAWVGATAQRVGRSLQAVERSLYIAGIEAGTVQGRTWTDYATAVRKIV